MLSSNLLKKKRFKKFLKVTAVGYLVLSWLLLSWPQIPFTNFPPKISETRAAVAFVDETHASARNTTTVVIGTWTATSGNLLVLFCSADANDTFTDPSGWTPILTNSSANGSMEAYFKASDGTETTVTCTKGAGNAEIYGQVLEYSGVDTSAASANIGANGSGDATAECTAISPSGNNIYIAGVQFLDANTGAGALSWASEAMNERVDDQLAAGPGAERENYGSGDYFTFSGSHGTTVTHSGGGSYGWVCLTVSFNETVANPVVTQDDFRWYADQTTVTLTDLWGTVITGDNEDISIVPTGHEPPTSGSQMRLQINATVTIANLDASTQDFILEYKEGTDQDCSTGSWTAVGAIAASGTDWRFFNNGSLADQIDEVNQISTSDVVEDYVESDPTATNPNAINTTQSGEWDFAIETGTTIQEATSYAFRLIQGGTGQTVAYTAGDCPTLETAPGTANLMRHGNTFVSGVEKGFYWVD